ncbi:PREDICTED: uncharacterized protein LOC105453233 [Wasmannia auropunctata]|uniref:uncharacterized protein LOC105453233 n=1 Tax=Wasmannia auropunctata TaxID=64793 RepID=UPI0005EE7E26|nr:PREDICTED: uncharacterized protein LOC105453233 [Wasmannia auropunctata]
MLRNLATKWISLKRIRATMFYPSYNARTYSERRRRTGTGRKREIFEERAAASEDEYFRRETARQLKELREKIEQVKAEKKENDKEQKKSDQADKTTSKKPNKK